MPATSPCSRRSQNATEAEAAGLPGRPDVDAGTDDGLDEAGSSVWTQFIEPA